MSFSADQLRQQRSDSQTQRDVQRNDALLEDVARGRGSWAYVHGDPQTMANHYRSRGFNVEITHGGLGCKVSF